MLQNSELALRIDQSFCRFYRNLQPAEIDCVQLSYARIPFLSILQLYPAIDPIRVIHQQAQLSYVFYWKSSVYHWRMLRKFRIHLKNELFVDLFQTDFVLHLAPTAQAVQLQLNHIPSALHAHDAPTLQLHGNTQVKLAGLAGKLWVSDHGLKICDKPHVLIESGVQRQFVLLLVHAQPLIVGKLIRQADINHFRLFNCVRRINHWLLLRERRIINARRRRYLTLIFLYFLHHRVCCFTVLLTVHWLQ